MNVLIKKINLSNINILYSQYYNYYKIYYICVYIKLIGITINIKFYKYKKYNNLYYLYINDKETYNLLHNIECVFMKNIPSNLFRIDNDEKYIICNYINDIKDKTDVNINISKLKYMYNNYVPIINII